MAKNEAKKEEKKPEASPPKESEKPAEKPAPESKPQEDNIKEAIDKLRDVDKESDKPKKHAPPEPKPTKAPSPKPTPGSSKTDVPKSETTGTIMPYLRSDMRGISNPRTSTYVPSAYMMYYIVHLMDNIMRKNYYFRRSQDAWHPLISRIYFGILFIIQTIRAEISCGIASSKKIQFYSRFARDYSPETLFVPGPLVNTFEHLAPSRPEFSLDAFVCPTIPDTIGPATAETVLTYDVNHNYALLLPQLPLLYGFYHTLISALPNAIPHYANANTFANNVDHTINGHIFNAGNWTNTERSALLSPGMLYPTESNNDIDTAAHENGQNLQIPTLVAQTPIATIEQYTQLAHNDWFSEVNQIMTGYSEYFTDSRPLSACTTMSPASGLIITNYVHSNVNANGQLPSATITHAFPQQGNFALDAQHQTYESEIPPATMLLSQSVHLNCTVPAINNGVWADLGTNAFCRTGPYWTEDPIKRRSIVETHYKGLSSIMTRYFALPRAEKRKQ